MSDNERNTEEMMGENRIADVEQAIIETTTAEVAEAEVTEAANENVEVTEAVNEEVAVAEAIGEEVTAESAAEMAFEDENCDVEMEQWTEMPMQQQVPQGQWNEIPMGQAPQGQWNNMPPHSISQGQWNTVPMGQAPQGQWNGAPVQQAPQGQWNGVPVQQTPQGQWNGAPMQQAPQGQWNGAPMQQALQGQWNGAPMQQAPQGQWNGAPMQQAPQGQWNGAPMQQAPQSQWNGAPMQQAPQGQWNGTPMQQAPQGQWNQIPPVAGGYAPAPVQPQKKNNTLMIVLFVVLGLLVGAALIYFGIRTTQTIVESMNSGKENRKNSDEDIMDYFYGENDDYEWDFDLEEDDDTDDEDSYDDDLDDILEAWAGGQDNEVYVPKESDPYYVEFVDSIRNDLQYSVEEKKYEYYDEEDVVYISIEYPEITADNLDKIETVNKHIEDTAKYYLKNYANNPEAGGVSYCYIEVFSYVTYMDEDIMSIVLDQRFEIGDMSEYHLASFNIDMKTGQLLWNKQLVNYSDELVSEFRRMSDLQNGTVEILETISDEELKRYLTDEYVSVAFYTPVGLEIGFSYGDYETTGWVTATIKDHEKY